jgi:L-ascorbate metabolism protein UlaG (beta-lactamase superfamily)
MRMLLRRVDPALYDKTGGEANPALSLRYLGTAGFVLEGGDRTVVIDPFLTRPDLKTTLFRPMSPDAEAIRRHLPQADDVLVGHSHYDHVLDAPELCRQTGARFISSADGCNVARAAGLPEHQLVETSGREDIACGDRVTVRGVPSRHGRVYMGRVTLPGHITRPPPWPPRLRDLPHGLVLNWHVNVDGVRVVHVDSADFIERELEGLRADVLCLCAIGRNWRPGYTATAIAMLQPRYVVACHWDWFGLPYSEAPRLLPGVDLPGFVDEIAACGATPVVLPFEGRFGVAATSPPDAVSSDRISSGAGSSDPALPLDPPEGA